MRRENRARKALLHVVLRAQPVMFVKTFLTAGYVREMAEYYVEESPGQTLEKNIRLDSEVLRVIRLRTKRHKS